MGTRTLVAGVAIGILSVIGVRGVPAAEAKAAPRVARRPQPVVTVPRSRSDLVLHMASARELPATVTAGDKAAIHRIVAKLKGKHVQGANADWRMLAGSISRRKDGTDIQKVRLTVMRQAYLAENKGLRDAAERASQTSRVQEALGEHLAELRRVAAEPSKGERITLRRIDTVHPFRPGTENTVDWRQASMTKSELADYIKQVEQRFNSARDDAQLANMDLQNIIQKQQQMIRTISNINKMLDDTAMAVIGNMRG